MSLCAFGIYHLTRLLHQLLELVFSSLSEEWTHSSGLFRLSYQGKWYCREAEKLILWSRSIITQRLESIIHSQDAGDWTKISKERWRSAEHTKERRKVVNVNNAKERRKMGDH